VPSSRSIPSRPPDPNRTCLEHCRAPVPATRMCNGDRTSAHPLVGPLAPRGRWNPEASRRADGVGVGDRGGVRPRPRRQDPRGSSPTVPTSCPRRGARGPGTLRRLGPAPIALGGLLGDVVLTEAGFDELFLTAAASAFGALIISLWLPERTPALEDTGAKTEYFEAIRRPDLLPSGSSSARSRWCSPATSRSPAPSSTRSGSEVSDCSSPSMPALRSPFGWHSPGYPPGS